jgi:hypothetical protein
MEREGFMTGKCMNPFCRRPFHESHGKAFAIQFPPSSFERHHDLPGPGERFWLCKECAQIMTIAVRREFDSVSVRIINLAPNGATKLAFAIPPKPVFAGPELLRSA